jgi:hypothetical protein
MGNKMNRSRPLKLYQQLHIPLAPLYILTKQSALKGTNDAVRIGGCTIVRCTG